MVSLIAGVVAVVLGIVGIVGWWWQFLLVLKGTLPALFILCGAVAIAAGFGTVKDKMKCSAKKEEAKEEKPEEKAAEVKEEVKAEIKEEKKEE
jgi:hypothetical protein